MSAAYYRSPEAGATYASTNGQSNPSGFSTMSGGGQAFQGKAAESGGMELPWMTAVKMIQQAGRNTAGAMQQYGLNQRSDAMNRRNQDIATGQAGVQSAAAVMDSLRQRMAEDERQRRLVGGLSAMAGT